VSEGLAGGVIHELKIRYLSNEKTWRKTRQQKHHAFAQSRHLRDGRTVKGIAALAVLVDDH
jgi:hypothetical protein